MEDAYEFDDEEAWTAHLRANDEAVSAACEDAVAELYAALRQAGPLAEFAAWQPELLVFAFVTDIVRQPVLEKGRVAGEMLLERGERNRPRRVTLPTELVVGEPTVEVIE